MACDLVGQTIAWVRDIKVDGREAPDRAATGCPLGRGAHACHVISQRSFTVAALSGSMVYARILAIGGRLGKSPHFYVAHPPGARVPGVDTNVKYNGAALGNPMTRILLSA